jgi:hypothetical protein
VNTPDLGGFGVDLGVVPEASSASILAISSLLTPCDLRNAFNASE